MPLSTLFAVLLTHQKSSCRCTGLVFHSSATKRFAKKLVQLRRGGPQSECMSRAAFPVSTSSKSRPETSSPRFNSTCHFLARATLPLRKHLGATQHSEIVDFLPCLELLRWTAKARDARVEAFLLCSRLAVHLTAHASPAHLWSGFLRAWSKIGPFERSSRRCGQLMFWSRDFILAGRIRPGHSDRKSLEGTMEERQQNTLDVLPSSAPFLDAADRANWPRE